jgi:hypothetical protein
MEHLCTFLNDQVKAPGGPTARVAVTTAEDGADDMAAADGATAPAAGTGSDCGGLGTAASELLDCCLRVEYGDLIEGFEEVEHRQHRQGKTHPSLCPSTLETTPGI